jgi:hypothetical protein
VTSAWIAGERLRRAAPAEQVWWRDVLDVLGA